MQVRLLAAVLAALALEGCAVEEDTGCVEFDPAAGSCPTADAVSLDDLFTLGSCGVKITKVLGEDQPEPSVGGIDSATELCCYQVKVVDNSLGDCIAGRPWRDGDDGAAVFPIDGGEACPGWARLAQLEHASVAAFARLTLELLHHGAPTHLLLATQRAAADEVAHCDAALDVLARRTGRRPALRARASAAPLVLDRSLADLAADLVRDGCVGETVSAALLRAAAEAGGPDADVLTRLADDEERHAALSWQLTAWALRSGGEPVRAAIQAALRAPVHVEHPGEDGPLSALGPNGVEAAANATLRDVVGPAARVLLGERLAA